MTMEIKFLSRTAAESGLALMSFQPRDEAESDEFWRKVELFVYSSASVASFFDPNPRRNKRLQRAFDDRGEELLALFDVSIDDFASIGPVRHSFAHIDERFEEFWLDEPSHNLVIRNYGGPGSVVFEGPHQRFHEYDPVNNELSFRGAQIDVAAVVTLMGLIWQRTDGVDEILWGKLVD